jgi:hypothetical protein
LFSIQTSTTQVIELGPSFVSSIWGLTLGYGSGVFAVLSPVYEITSWNYSVLSVKFTTGNKQGNVYNLSSNITYIGDLSGVFSFFGQPTYTQTNQSLFIGRRTTSYFGGNIANTTVYNRVLTATEVLQNFNATRSRFGV